MIYLNASKHLNIYDVLILNKQANKALKFHTIINVNKSKNKNRNFFNNNDVL